jgi:hypothetical protein
MFDVREHVLKSKFASGVEQHGALEKSMGQTNPKEPIDSRRDDV